MPEDLGPDETQILAAMLGISEMVGGLTDIQEIIGTVVRIVPQLVRNNRCAIFSYDALKSELRCEQAFGPDLDQIRILNNLVLKESDIPRLSQKVLKGRLPAIVRDAAKEEIFPPILIAKLGLKSLLVVPLICKDRILGLMMLDDTRGVRYFTSKEINIVAGIATLAAIAMDSTNVREELESERGRLEALAGAISDAYIVLDTRFKVKHLSASGERLLGWPAGEVVGKQCSEVFKVRDLHGIVVCGSSCLGRRLAWGENVTGQSSRLHFQRGDGTTVLCDVHAAAVKDADGQVIEIVYALSVVTHTMTPTPVKETMPTQTFRELEQIVLDGK